MMQALSFRLNAYITRGLLGYICLVLGVISFLVFIGDFIEVARIVTNTGGTDLGLISRLAWYKNYTMVQKMWPVVICIAATLFYINLVRSGMLVAVRSFGAVSRQFIYPALCLWSVLYLLHCTFVLPLTGDMVRRYAIEKAARVARLSEGQQKAEWLFLQEEGGLRLFYKFTGSVFSLYFITNNNIAEMTAGSFIVERGHGIAADAGGGAPQRHIWRLYNVTYNDHSGLATSPQRLGDLSFVSELSDGDLAAYQRRRPEADGLWQMPRLLEVFERRGVDMTLHRIFLYKSVLLLPVGLLAVVLCYGLAVSRLSRDYAASVKGRLAAAFLLGYLLYLLLEYGTVLAVLWLGSGV